MCDISETWFNSSVRNSEFVPEGYQCFRQDRELKFHPEGTYTQQGHGGVVLIAKNNLKPVEFKEGSVNAEIVWCTISPHDNIEVLIGVAYRPDKGKWTYMNQLSQSICNINNSNCILLGDFNFPHITRSNWVNKTADSALSQ